MYSARLPYIDNTRAILATLAINLGAIFLFNWPQGVTYSEIMWDSLFCAIITTAINMWIIHAKLKKMRAAGKMPVQVPESPFMQRLPQNPIMLWAIYAVGFAVLTVGCNAVVLRCFGIQNMAFAPWAVYKLIYATVLSVIVVQYCIFRYVQPDWAAKEQETSGNPEQVTTDAPVKNPLPEIGVFKAIYGAVTGNIALNMLIGYLLGGAMIESSGVVVVFPTTVEGIPITGLVFGFIVGILVTNGVVSAMNAIIRRSGPAILDGAVMDKRITWLPKGRLALTCVVCVCAMAFSAVALRAILLLFNIPFLNFYQFSVFITIYATLLGKPLSFILTKRCMQPDYLRYILARSKAKDSAINAGEVDS